VPRGGAEGPADEDRRIDDAHDLHAPVLGAGRKLENAFDDIGNKNGIIAFPDQLFSFLQRSAAAYIVERFEFLLPGRNRWRCSAQCRYRKPTLSAESSPNSRLKGGNSLHAMLRTQLSDKCLRRSAAPLKRSENRPTAAAQPDDNG
jgi:hypothetical protein